MAVRGVGPLLSAVHSSSVSHPAGGGTHGHDDSRSSVQVEHAAMNGFGTLGSFVVREACEISTVLDMPRVDALAAKEAASRGIAPAPTNMAAMADAAVRFHTGDAVLDGMLQGGLRVGDVTELVGDSNAGKTQLALMLAAECLLHSEEGHEHQEQQQGQGQEGAHGDHVESKHQHQAGGGGVLYVDTEGGFAPERLLQLLTSKHHHAADGDGMPAGGEEDSGGVLAKTMSRLVVQHIETPQQLQSLVHGPQLERLMITNNIKMVIIDSLAALYRNTYDPPRPAGSGKENSTTQFAGNTSNYRSKHDRPAGAAVATNTMNTNDHHSPNADFSAVLSSMAGECKRLGAALGATFVICNHLLTLKEHESKESGKTVASLGISWAHTVTSRFTMHDGVIRIDKCPFAPSVTFPYVITEHGVVLQEN